MKFQNLLTRVIKNLFTVRNFSYSDFSKGWFEHNYRLLSKSVQIIDDI